MSYEIKDDYAEHADARTAEYKHDVAPTHWQIEMEQEIRRKFKRESNKKEEDK
jgi:hypothetical protein